jgi:hypothetical protein
MPIVQPEADPVLPAPAAAWPTTFGQTPVKLVAEAEPLPKVMAIAAVPASRSEVSLVFMSAKAPFIQSLSPAFVVARAMPGR